jgi:hypothetical protein
MASLWTIRGHRSGGSGAEGTLMEQGWKTVDLFVPSDRTASEVLRYLEEQVSVIAHEAGEFVRQIRIGEGVDQANGWHRWSASYLPDIPGVIGGND